MRKPLFILFALLLILGLALPMAGLGETTCFIDVLGREVIVPDGWAIETDAEGYLNFINSASQDRIVIYDTGMPVEDIAKPELTVEIALMIARVAAESAGGSKLTSNAVFDFSTDDQRIVGGSVTYEQDGKQKIMWSYTFAAGGSTWGRCLFQFPVDGSLDISWFTDVMEAVFPELAVVHADKAGKADGNGVGPGNIAEETAADDFLIFGSYQGEAIEWRVLDVDEDGRMLLLSEKILDARPYHKKFAEITWEKCSLRAWLNKDFFKAAFTKAERARIAETHVVNDDNPWYGTKGGNDTRDRIFLLSISEAGKYLIGGTEQRSVNKAGVAFPTDYAIRQGAYVWGKDTGGNGAGFWWLRSPEMNSKYAATIGGIGGFGNLNVDNKAGSVRPALWLNP